MTDTPTQSQLQIPGGPRPAAPPRLACNATAPPRRAPSGKYLPAVRCNRTPGHDGQHQRRNPATFAVVAEWS